MACCPSFRFDQVTGGADASSGRLERPSEKAPPRSPSKAVAKASRASRQIIIASHSITHHRQTPPLPSFLPPLGAHCRRGAQCAKHLTAGFFYLSEWWQLCSNAHYLFLQAFIRLSVSYSCVCGPTVQFPATAGKTSSARAYVSKAVRVFLRAVPKKLMLLGRAAIARDTVCQNIVSLSSI